MALYEAPKSVSAHTRTPTTLQLLQNLLRREQKLPSPTTLQITEKSITTELPIEAQGEKIAMIYVSIEKAKPQKRDEQSVEWVVFDQTSHIATLQTTLQSEIPHLAHLKHAQEEMQDACAVTRITDDQNVSLHSASVLIDLKSPDLLHNYEVRKNIAALFAPKGPYCHIMLYLPQGFEDLAQEIIRQGGKVVGQDIPSTLLPRLQEMFFKDAQRLSIKNGGAYIATCLAQASFASVYFDVRGRDPEQYNQDMSDEARLAFIQHYLTTSHPQLASVSPP